SMAQGIEPPRPRIVEQPRGGTFVTHRVAVLLRHESSDLGSGWTSKTTPRSSAEPRLDAWIGSLLGNPSKVCCRVDLPDPTTDDPTRRKTKLVTLASLQL